MRLAGVLSRCDWDQPSRVFAGTAHCTVMYSAFPLVR